MSHVATIDLEVRDLDTLERAARRIGLELVRGQQTYRWFGESVGDSPTPAGFTVDDLGRCEHALRLIPGTYDDGPGYGDGPYEIGVVQRRDGRPGYTLLWDFFAGGWGLEARVGPECGRLKQAYATEVATQQARLQGFSVTERLQQDGSLRLVLSK